MFSWMSGEEGGKGKKNQEVYEGVSEGLKNIYRQKLLPLEKEYNFHDFHSPALDDPDFDAKPMVMLVGQYSTGKTTFIRYLLEADFPGIRIGPEPTTDRFIAVMHAETDGVVPAMRSLSTRRSSSGRYQSSETPFSTGFNAQERILLS